jgi:hypothetical protein
MGARKLVKTRLCVIKAVFGFASSVSGTMNSTTVTTIGDTSDSDYDDIPELRESGDELSDDDALPKAGISSR